MTQVIQPRGQLWRSDSSSKGRCSVEPVSDVPLEGSSSRLTNRAYRARTGLAPRAALRCTSRDLLGREQHEVALFPPCLEPREADEVARRVPRADVVANAVPTPCRTTRRTGSDNPWPSHSNPSTQLFFERKRSLQTRRAAAARSRGGRADFSRARKPRVPMPRTVGLIGSDERRLPHYSSSLPTWAPS
jgi:hypothetical protein